VKINKSVKLAQPLSFLMNMNPYMDAVN